MLEAVEVMLYLYGRGNGRCVLYARGAEGVPFVLDVSEVVVPYISPLTRASSLLVAALYAGGDALCTTGAEGPEVMLCML